MSGELRKAGLLLRVFAKALDFIIIAAVAEIIPTAGFYAGLAYLLISDGLFDGRSFGKYLMGLRVISAKTGEQCSMKESIFRNSPLGLGFLFLKFPFFGWIILLSVVVFEFLMLIGSSNGMRFGDELAKTVAIEKNHAKTGTVKQTEE